MVFFSFSLCSLRRINKVVIFWARKSDFSPALESRAFFSFLRFFF